MDRLQSVIFLSGVLPSDCKDIDEVFTSRLLEAASVTDSVPNVVYDTIPPIFTTLDEWPCRTNILCWVCDGEITGPPVFIPQYVKISGETCEMGVVGNFCWFNCAASYIINNVYVDKRIEFMKNLLILYKIFTGKVSRVIVPSETRHVMLKYGGCMTEVEYYSSISKAKVLQLNDADDEYVHTPVQFPNIIYDSYKLTT